MNSALAIACSLQVVASRDKPVQRPSAPRASVVDSSVTRRGLNEPKAIKQDVIRHAGINE